MFIIYLVNAAYIHVCGQMYVPNFKCSKMAIDTDVFFASVLFSQGVGLRNEVKWKRRNVCKREWCVWRIPWLTDCYWDKSIYIHLQKSTRMRDKYRIIRIKTSCQQYNASSGNFESALWSDRHPLRWYSMHCNWFDKINYQFFCVCVRNSYRRKRFVFNSHSTISIVLINKVKCMKF